MPINGLILVLASKLLDTSNPTDKEISSFKMLFFLNSIGTTRYLSSLSE